MFLEFRVRFRGRTDRRGAAQDPASQAGWLHRSQLPVSHMLIEWRGLHVMCCTSNLNEQLSTFEEIATFGVSLIGKWVKVIDKVIQ